MKQHFKIGTTGTFSTYVYADNRKIVPTSGEITVYKPGSTEKLIDAQAMTVAADGLLSYALTTVHNADVGFNFKAEVSYVYNAVTYYATLFYDVVRSGLVSVLVDDDIVTELPQLRKLGWRVHGTADSGSATTIVDANLTIYEDDVFTGGLATSLAKEETREITDFVQSTGTVTTAAFSGAVATGEKYILQRSFSKETKRAFEKVRARLVRAGKNPDKVLDPYDLREPHVFMAVAEICKAQMSDTGEGGMWWDLWKDYERQADEAFNGLNLKYDESNDGYMSNGELGRRLNTNIKVRF